MGRGNTQGLAEYCRRVRSTTLAEVGPDRVLTYHGTQVAVLRGDGSIRLDSGGYKTMTTKARMNAALSEDGLPWCVYQRDGVWFIMNIDNRESIPFEDGIILGAPAGRKVK